MYKPVKLILPETICRICKINVGLCHTDGLCQSRPYRVQSARRRAGATGFEPADIRVKAACVRTDFTIPQYFMCGTLCVPHERKEILPETCSASSGKEQHIF